MSGSEPVRGVVLSPGEMSAWRTFLRAHAQVVRLLEAELIAEHDLSLAAYDVLVQLVEAPEARLRMTELAERVLLSRSGLTRLVDRLEREGLAERVAVPSDARGTFAVLTTAGRTRLRVAAATHLRGVREHVTAHFTAAELEQLGLLLSRVPGPAAPAAEPGAADPTDPEPYAGTPPTAAPGVGVRQ